MNRKAWWHGEDGQVTAFVTVLTAGILTLSGLVLDGGLALAATTRANGQAEAAARAGAQAIDLTAYRATGSLRLLPSDAMARARAHLTAEGAIGDVTATVDTVTVTVTATQATQLLGLVGIGTITVHGRGAAHPQSDTATGGP
ncbi:pilus assembly protein TadG-related protein [Actinophytocola sp. KF-1]